MSRAIAQRTLVQLFADPEEQPWLLRMSYPEGAEQRPLYAQWLSARDPLRAELLLVLCDLAGSDPGVNRVALRARLRALGARVDPQWLAFVRGSLPTFNCGEAREELPAVRFAYECPRRWEDLDPTEDPAVRRCTSCNEQVFRTDSRAEAEEHARAGHCITVTSRLSGRLHEELTRDMLGRPHLPTLWGEKLFRGR